MRNPVEGVDLMRRVKLLDPMEQSLFRRYYMEGLSGGRIAEITNCPSSSVYLMLHRVREKLHLPGKLKDMP